VDAGRGHSCAIVGFLASRLGSLGGVAVRSLTNGLVDTTTAHGKLVFGLFALLAEYEAALIKERTQAELAAARARGRKGGRKPKMTPELIDKAQRMYDSRTFTMAEIAESCRGHPHDHLPQHPGTPPGALSVTFRSIVRRGPISSATVCKWAPARNFMIVASDNSGGSGLRGATRIWTSPFAARIDADDCVAAHVARHAVASA